MLNAFVPITEPIRLTMAVAIIVVLRLVAVRWNIRLPDFHER